MAYRLFWLVKDYVLVGQSYDVLTKEDLAANIVKSLELIQVADHPIHYIADGNNVRQFTLKLVDLQKILRPFADHPNLAWLLTLNSTPIERMIAGLAVQFLHSKARSFATLEDALKFLMDMDTTIPRVNPADAVKAAITGEMIAASEVKAKT